MPGFDVPILVLFIFFVFTFVLTAAVVVVEIVIIFVDVVLAIIVELAASYENTVSVADFHAGSAAGFAFSRLGGGYVDQK